MPEFFIDGKAVNFSPGQNVLEAANEAGVYIPHLCFHPEFGAHGSCRVCIVEIDGAIRSACTLPATEGMQVNNINARLQQLRCEVLEMLFVEGNHVCPACEKSGACTLQSVAEFCGMLNPPFEFQYPNRKVDASHADYMLDYNRCILCELCVRASRDVDHKSVFVISGRGHNAHIQVNAKDGLLGNSDFVATDRAATICPVGVFLPKGKGFDVPIGKRSFDVEPIDQQQVKK